MDAQVSRDPQADKKKKAQLVRLRKFVTALVYIAGIIAIACLLGVVVAVFMLGLGKNNDEARVLLLYILTGSFVGGAAIFACAAYGFSVLMTKASARELDFRELMDGEESFFVGEGTLATFGEEGITLHDEGQNVREPVFVPYKDMRFIGICTRRRAREKGEWCIAIEIPVRYLAKNGDPKSGPVLVQADFKPRLLDVIKAHNLTLLGETPPSGKAENKKFTPVKRCFIPDKLKRRRQLIFIVLGALCVVGGVLVSIFYEPAFGALLGAAGLFLLGKSVASYIRARSELSVYL